MARESLVAGIAPTAVACRSRPTLEWQVITPHALLLWEFIMFHVQADRRILFATALSGALLILLAACSSDDPTRPPTDTVAPTVTVTNPVHNAVGVAVITASFSEPMDAATITTTTLTLFGPGETAVAGTVTYTPSPPLAQFIPATALAAETAYVATVTTGVMDAAGNALAANYTWNFSTAEASDPQTAPDLGEAAAFVVLAGSTVTSTGATALTGDLGVSPGTSVTGFPPGTLTGSQHAGNATAATAMTDLTTAYDDAAGRIVAPITVAGNLGGLTLPPGLYRSTSALEISSGDLTLDAQGDPDAVFIFQIASTLTVASGHSIILSGDATSANVFWQVGSSATFGTTSTIEGTVLADQSITFNTAASLNGRAFARSGAVSLAANAGVLPTP
jgi:hypothetical protein